jgi:hypothetical protein
MTRSRLLALPVLALLLIVVAAAAVTSSQNTTPAFDEPAAVDTLSVLMTLFGITVAGLTAYIVWAILRAMHVRRGSGAGNSERFGWRTQAAAGAGALAGLTLIIVIVRAFGVAHRSGGQKIGLVVPPGQSLPPTRPLPFSASAGGLTALAVLVLVAVIFITPRLIRASRQRSAPDFASLGGDDHPSLELSGAGAASAIAGVEVATPEQEPDPRRAVIAAWVAMTQAIAGVWRPRRDSEAPREYLESALEDAGVRPTSAERLTDLFEEARFGGRTVDETVRVDAITALAEIRQELAVGPDSLRQPAGARLS